MRSTYSPTPTCRSSPPFHCNCTITESSQTCAKPLLPSREDLNTHHRLLCICSTGRLCEPLQKPCTSLACTTRRSSDASNSSIYHYKTATRNTQTNLPCLLLFLSLLLNSTASPYFLSSLNVNASPTLHRALEHTDVFLQNIDLLWPLVTERRRTALNAFATTINGPLTIAQKEYISDIIMPAEQWPRTTPFPTLRVFSPPNLPDPLPIAMRAFLPLDIYLAQAHRALADFQNKVLRSVNLTGPPSRLSNKEPSVVPAEFRKGSMTSLTALFGIKLQELRVIYGGWETLPHFFGERNLHPGLPNEDTTASLVTTHIVEPAGFLLSGAVTAIHRRQDYNYPELPSTPLIRAISNIVGFNTVSQLNLIPNLKTIGVPLANINNDTLRRVLVDQPPPPQHAAADLGGFATREEFRQEFETWLKRTRPDVELVLVEQARRPTYRVLPIEVKSSATFSEDRVLGALKNFTDAFQDSDLGKRAEEGCIPMREAFRRDQLKEENGTIFWEESRFIYECMGQAYKYIAQKGLTWGVITSCDVTIIIQIAWDEGEGDGDVAYYYVVCGDMLEIPSTSGRSTEKIGLVEILAILGACNVEIGLQSNDKYIQLCQKIRDDYSDHQPHRSSTESTDGRKGAGPRTQPPRQSRHPSTNRDQQTSHAPADDTEVLKALTWMPNEEKRQMVAKLIRPDEPGIRYAFSRQRRLSFLILAIRDFVSGTAWLPALVHDLHYYLGAIEVDPNPVDPQRNAICPIDSFELAPLCHTLPTSLPNDTEAQTTSSGGSTRSPGSKFLHKLRTLSRKPRPKASHLVNRRKSRKLGRLSPNTENTDSSSSRNDSGSCTGHTSGESMTPPSKESSA